MLVLAVAPCVFNTAARFILSKLGLRSNIKPPKYEPQARIVSKVKQQKKPSFSDFFINDNGREHIQFPCLSKDSFFVECPKKYERPWENIYIDPNKSNYFG